MDFEHMILQVDLSFQALFTNSAGERTRAVLFLKMAGQRFFGLEGRCAAGPSTSNNSVWSAGMVGYS